jgi:hypothetical protein
MGYSVCITAALFPPVWFGIVDPLAKEANELGKPTEVLMNKSVKTLWYFVAAQIVVITAVFWLSFVLK